MTNLDDTLTDMTLRDRARAAVRDEVTRQAWRLFAQQGFGATTIDQIAQASGMSRRTFFRYFTGKDELILCRLIESGEWIADALRARPAHESAWTALEAALQVAVARVEAHDEMARPLQLMLRDEPDLRASLQERRLRWQELFAPLVAHRLPQRGDVLGADSRAAAITLSALACYEVAQRAWAEQPGSSLGELLHETIESVRS